MLRGYTPRSEPVTGLRAVCGTNELEEFLEESQARRLLCHVGDPDPRPGKVWSKANNDPVFLLALQKVKSGEWMNDENRIYWEYQHVGSDLPN